ncbi:MAG TPA: cyclic nucleotide-binding domain-containing protein [Bryobacteraceae bacterium]|nr:cyclic nucleotide-binding domain-containing protein [Bryobacteraceae bacterium]
MQLNSGNQQISTNGHAAGAFAVLGMDVVSFSTLDEDDQIGVIGQLMKYVRQALMLQDLKEDDYRWSPAGDGGYLTFLSVIAGRSAIDVAFSIFQQVANPPRKSFDRRFTIRAALHAGSVQESADLGRDTNIWGMGINTTARILSISDENQLLVSKQYHDTYVKDQPGDAYHFGEPYWRTVKHGITLDVMNASKSGLGLGGDEERGRRWRYLGGLWNKTAEEFEHLMSDTMRSGDSIAAIAAARYLLDMGEEQRVRDFCKILSNLDAMTVSFPVEHFLFSGMPSDVLFEVVKSVKPKVIGANEVICEDGVDADSCFFPVSGRIVLEIRGRDEPAPVKKGQMLGEFSLWIPNLKRTARIRSLDPGLVLELGHRPLETVLRQHEDVANIVYSLIQRRVVENTLLSPALFPGMAKAVKDGLSKFNAKCVKVASGEKLNLSSQAFIMLVGKVRVQCANGGQLDVVGGGHFDQMPVVGIYSTIGNPDGEEGEVLEDTVAVQIGHDTLQEIQTTYKDVGRLWSGLYGTRLHDVKCWSPGQKSKAAQTP